MTTTYTLDLNAGLTQVLADGTNTYLYGYERIAQFSASETGYYLGDVLGSVRQMTDEDGVVMLTKQYEPYGDMLSSTGSGSSVFGFVGEQTDLTGLTYLRARFYTVSDGRFLSKDMWGGNANMPMSYNGWLYSYANPINFVDPSGQCTPGFCAGQNTNPRDLTSWLYNEMVENAHSPAVGDFKGQNWAAAHMAKWFLCDIGKSIEDALLEGISLPEVIVDSLAQHWSTALSASILHGSALYDYSQLVKDGAIWDFKDEIGLKLGPGITLCGSSGCVDDIEYSVPGNIHFAYIGIAAGLPGWEIQAGAAYAEITDPAHNSESPQYVGEYISPTFFQIIGWTPWDLSTINFGDEPKDHEAVTLGIKLYEKYQGQMSLTQFKSELSNYSNLFSRCFSDPNPVGYFNNKGNSYKLPSNRCP